MSSGIHANLSRTCEVIEIPSGVVSTLAEGTPVRIMQSRGDSYTVWTDYGQMYRIDGKDADAIGQQTPPEKASDSQDTGEFNEQMVWDILKTVYDPEIPVNIVDLGLIYSCTITPLDDQGKKIDIQMSMTAPGCGMGNVLKGDVENRISKLPSVKAVNVEVVFDPPWDMSRMSEAARLQLGF
ncbi:MAG TPA: putative Fe-S cluster assembly protein SufT [Terriglobales bacterium]|jgi:probable FeS assembly SUF system protein SufT|nr:putative Fe-S cluster assembly protein SufT [Terriglobales bacterium]